MAIFGAMGDATTGGRAAAGAALDMRASIGRMNAERSAAGEAVLQLGVGMHVETVTLERPDFPSARTTRRWGTQ